MGRQREMILVVEPDESTRRSLAKVLDRSGYSCVTAADLTDARARLSEETFALVLTALELPGGSGLDLLMSLSSEQPDSVVLFMTTADDPKAAQAALDLGAYGYLIRPLEPNEVLIAVAGAFKRRSAEMETRAHRTRLEQMVRDRTQEMLGYISNLERAEQEMKTLQREMIQRLSLAAEFRDDDTPRHVQRVSRYCALIAERLGESPERCELIGTAGAMHDVGKIGIPDSILMKPGGLSDAEWDIMKRHCEIGHRLLSGTGSEILNTAATIALTHHERVDGTGYPQGLKGEDIPIEGRIAAIADVFDALTSHRVYSRAVSSRSAVTMLKAGRGTHFDDVLLDLFLSEMGVVLGIQERFADPAPDAGRLAADEDPRRIP